MSTESKTETKAHVMTQTQFLEQQIREGFTTEDVRMWQNLCKDLALLKDDAEETMHGVLSICDHNGISPLAVASSIRDLGYKTYADGIQEAMEYYHNNPVDEDYCEPTAEEASATEERGNGSDQWKTQAQDIDDDDDVDDKPCDGDSNAKLRKLTLCGDESF